jgi:FkbM family methyltransferase
MNQDSLVWYKVPINKALYWISKFGIAILSYRKLLKYLEFEFDSKRLEKELVWIKKYGIKSGVDYSRIRKESKSQLGQDLWVAISSDFKKHGTFIEIGAADGIRFSNTFLLEKILEWEGVCVEPAKIWHEVFLSNRKAVLDTRCCTGLDGADVEFIETQEPLLSVLSTHRFRDSHANERKSGLEYIVKTISLNNLFEQYFPEGYVDYLSIDVEGGEEEILEKFEFEKYSFSFASIEIGFDANKSKYINRLMEKNGYVRVWSDLSEFDDFYQRIGT